MDKNTTPLNEAMIAEDADLVKVIREAGEHSGDAMTGEEFLAWLASQ
jgi:hypothetical protein